MSHEMPDNIGLLGVATLRGGASEINSMPIWKQRNHGWGVQRLALLLIILQSIGIRAFPMAVVLSCLLVCLVLAPRITITFRHLFVFTGAYLVFILLSMRGMSDPKSIVYLSIIILTAFVYVMYVEKRWATVEIDLLQVTWWLSLHGLLSFLLYQVMPSLFITVHDAGVLRYKVLGIFVMTGWGKIRATGLCWEPGLLQYVANLSLFLGIKHAWPRWKLAVSLFTVVATQSTAGIFVLAPIMLYLLIARRRSRLQWVSIVMAITIVAVLAVTVFKENISDKLGGTNVSGLVRVRDTMVGWELMQSKPFTGHGQFDNDYLSVHSTVWEIEHSLFTKVYLAAVGEMYGGYTNGFMAVWSAYGIFFGTFIYWCFYNNWLIQGRTRERIIFLLISLGTFMSEPITNTTIFYVLAISGIYMQKKSRTEFVNRIAPEVS